VPAIRGLDPTDKDPPAHKAIPGLYLIWGPFILLFLFKRWVAQERRADMSECRSLDGFEILLLDLHYTARAGRADTRETNICGHGSRIDTSEFKECS
jgi:hypothetical protein